MVKFEIARSRIRLPARRRAVNCDIPGALPIRKPFRVLSLDGGGPWALIQARALAALYPNETGRQILRRFDLAVANSGGSITLAGLLKDLRPDEIADLFLKQSNRNRLFVSWMWPFPWLSRCFEVLPRWHARKKLPGLISIMDEGPNKVADVSMHDIPAMCGLDNLRLMIVSFDYYGNRGYFFRSYCSKLQTGASQFVPTLAGAVHASSNAPVSFFDEPAEIAPARGKETPRRFWDGGIGGYNNPVLLGVVDAIANGVAPRDILALSIGTGTVWRPRYCGPGLQKSERPIYREMARPSVFRDVAKLAKAILGDPPDAASLHAHVITSEGIDGALRIIRLNPVIRPEMSWEDRWSISDIYGQLAGNRTALANFQTLCEMPMDAVRQHEVELIDAAACAWLRDAIPNQPIRQNSDTAQCEIGHASFSAARQAWLAQVP